MNQPARKILALFSVAIVLLAQAVPAFAVCACDLPSDKPCCTATPKEPVAELDPSCCASEQQAPMESGSHAPQATGTASASVSAPGCAKDVVSSDLALVTVPKNTQTTRIDLGLNIVVSPVAQTYVPADDQASYDCLRVPPGKARSAPIFLLDASFLI